MKQYRRLAIYICHVMSIQIIDQMSGGGGATGHLMQLSGAIIFKGVIDCVLSVLIDTHLAHQHQWDQ